MELYKYTGSVAVMTVRFGKAETITLYDSYDDSVAPVRLDVRGALAEVHQGNREHGQRGAVHESRLVLRLQYAAPAHRGSGVPSGKALKTVVPAKVLTQTRRNPDELVCFWLPRFHQHEQAGLDGSR